MPTPVMSWPLTKSDTGDTDDLPALVLQHIRQARVDRGLTVAEVARRWSCSERLVEGLESGSFRGPYTWLAVYRYAAACGFRLTFVLEDLPEPPPLTA